MNKKIYLSFGILLFVMFSLIFVSATEMSSLIDITSSFPQLSGYEIYASSADSVAYDSSTEKLIHSKDADLFIRPKDFPQNTKFNFYATPSIEVDLVAGEIATTPDSVKDVTLIASNEQITIKQEKGDIKEFKFKNGYLTSKFDSSLRFGSLYLIPEKVVKTDDGYYYSKNIAPIYFVFLPLRIPTNYIFASNERLIIQSSPGKEIIAKKGSILFIVKDGKVSYTFADKKIEITGNDITICGGKDCIGIMNNELRKLPQLTTPTFSWDNLDGNFGDIKFSYNNKEYFWEQQTSSIKSQTQTTQVYSSSTIQQPHQTLPQQSQQPQQNQQSDSSRSNIVGGLRSKKLLDRKREIEDTLANYRDQIRLNNGGFCSFSMSSGNIPDVGLWSVAYIGQMKHTNPNDMFSPVTLDLFDGSVKIFYLLSQSRTSGKIIYRGVTNTNTDLEVSRRPLNEAYNLGLAVGYSSPI